MRGIFASGLQPAVVFNHYLLLNSFFAHPVLVMAPSCTVASNNDNNYCSITCAS